MPAVEVRLGVQMLPTAPASDSRNLHIWHWSDSQSSLLSKLPAWLRAGETELSWFLGWTVGHQGRVSILLSFHLETPPPSSSQFKQPHGKVVSKQNLGRSKTSVPCGWVELFGLEKTSKIIEFNLWLITALSTKLHHWVPHWVLSWMLPRRNFFLINKLLFDVLDWLYQADILMELIMYYILCSQEVILSSRVNFTHSSINEVRIVCPLCIT